MLLHFLTKYTRSGQVLPLLLCNIALLYMFACTYKYRHTCRHVKYAHMFLGTYIHAISFERNVHARLCLPCAEGVAGSLCPESARSYDASVSDSKCVCERESARARGRERHTSKGFPGVCKVVVKPRVPSLFRGEMSGGAIVKFCLYMNT